MSQEYITKTNAKKIYKLSDEILSTFTPIVKQNPHRRSMKMTLYKLDDILEFVSSRKGISVDKAKDMISEYETKVNEREEKKNAKVERRRTELTNALRNVHLEIREDSKLCRGYISGTIKDKSLEWIVHRMCQMKFLFEYADIKKCFPEAHENLGYFYSDEELFEEAEEIALSKVGGYPEVFPWLRNKS